MTKPPVKPRKTMLEIMLREYADLKFREGASYALGDRETAKAKADLAASLAARILKEIDR